jgi:hypothetical protein
MAELTAESRKKIPSSKFAGPDRSYPVEDHAHAANAKARAAEMLHKGKLSQGQYDHIVSMANSVLHKDKLGQATHAAAHKHGVKSW